MRECVKTMSASSDQPATDTSRSRRASNFKTATTKNDKPISRAHPDQATPGKNVPNSGTLPLAADTAIQETLFALSSGQTKSIEESPHKRIKWDEQAGFTGILDSDRMRWRRSFPLVNVTLELRMMNDWLLSNPTRRKKNYARYITSWLSRCQDVGGSSSASKAPATCSGVYKGRSFTKEEIEQATKVNMRPGGACEKVDALQRYLRNEITEAEYDRLVGNQA